MNRSFGDLELVLFLWRFFFLFLSGASTQQRQYSAGDTFERFKVDAENRDTGNTYRNECQLLVPFSHRLQRERVALRCQHSTRQARHPRIAMALF